MKYKERFIILKDLKHNGKQMLFNNIYNKKLFKLV